MTEWGPALLELAARLPGWALAGASMAERKRLAKVAEDLSSLAFWNDGMLSPLSRIAAGKGKKKDLDEISWKLRQTETNVDEVTTRLRETRAKFSTTLGMNVMRRLEGVVLQKVGPSALRFRLREFVANGVCSKVRASQLVREIEFFNAELDWVHRRILEARNG